VSGHPAASTGRIVCDSPNRHTPPGPEHEDDRATRTAVVRGSDRAGFAVTPTDRVSGPPTATVAMLIFPYYINN
jgi:hypothetical protein